MNLTLPQLVVGAAGALLIYAAIKNQSPVTIIKDALNGNATAGGGGAIKSPDTTSQGGTNTRITDRGGLGGEGTKDGITTRSMTPVSTSKVWVDPQTGKFMSV